MKIKQLTIICSLLICGCGSFLLEPGYSNAFLIHTNAYCEGDLSVEMDCAQGSGNGQLNRYELEIDSTEGTTGVTNLYGSGQTRVDVGYVADPDASMLGGSLSMNEQIGVNTANSQTSRAGAAGSSFDVEELSSSSSGSFNDGSYEIAAQGKGEFGVNVAENAATPDQSVYEKNSYELEGDGVFEVSGEYGFRGDVQQVVQEEAEQEGAVQGVEQEVESLDATASDSNTISEDHGVTSEDSPSQQHGLSITGPDSVTENTSADYSATLTFNDGSTQDVTQSTGWGEDSEYATIDSNGVLSTSEVRADQTVAITAFYTHEGVTLTAQQVVTIAASNLPPSKPVILSPSDGQTDCDLQPHIITEPFSDPEGDPHGQSQWQVSKNADFDPTILDMTSTQQLTELSVPDMLLEPETTYYVRVRFHDLFFELSDWSDAIEFSTSPQVNDASADKMPAELDVCDDTDLNGDEGADPTPDASPQVPVLEIGEICVDHNWKRVEFGKVFSNPVVIAKPVSSNDEDPALIRISNVDGTGFDICAQEWDYLNGLHSEETVSYVVMEAGTYILPDGSMVEAGKFETNTTGSFAAISFDQAFNQPPVVITAITTFNEIDAITARVREITTEGFEILMQEQKANAQEHATEEISYIAWETSSGAIDGITFEVAKTENVVNHEFHTICFTESFMNHPVFLADMQTTDGESTAILRWANKDIHGADIMINEEQSGESDINHTTEVVGYIVLAIEN